MVKLKPEFSSIVKRSVTSLVMIAIVMAVLWGGFPYVNIFGLVIASLLAWEWANMTPNNRTTVFAILYAVVATTVIFSISWEANVIVLSVGTLLAWLKSKGEKNRAILTLGVPYITVGVSSVVMFYYIVGAEATLWLMIMVWCTDIGGYLVGCSVKGPKLAPKISPNKTWSGLMGGILLAVCVSLLFGYLLDDEPNYSVYVYCAIMIAVVAQIGDLIESAIKRRLGIKDASNIIPGHGGVFDRIDGLLFVAPAALLYLFFMLNINNGL